MQTKGKKTKKNIEIDQGSRSLFIFDHQNRLRLLLKSVVENPYFEGFIYHLIAFNSLLLALDVPVLEDEYQIKTIKIMLNIISAIFIIECVIKILVMGFVCG